LDTGKKSPPSTVGEHHPPKGKVKTTLVNKKMTTTKSIEKSCLRRGTKGKDPGFKLKERNDDQLVSGQEFPT